MKPKWLTLFILSFILTSCFKDSTVTPTDQLTIEVNAIDNYIASSVTDFVAYSASGLRMAIHKFGDGAPAHSGQTVYVPLVGKLFASGTVFMTDTINDKIDNIKVTGLQNAIANLPAGSIATVYIPSAYGYGTTSSANVPANSTLTFDVTVAGVTRTTAEQTQFNADTAAIHKYVTDSDTAAILHPSGIWYSVSIAGTGATANPYQNVNVDYSGSILTTTVGSVFDSGSLSTQSIFGLIDGLKIGIPLIKEGGTMIFYIPSGLGYGTTATGSIPANSKLKFVIKLKSIATN